MFDWRRLLLLLTASAFLTVFILACDTKKNTVVTKASNNHILRVDFLFILEQIFSSTYDTPPYKCNSQSLLGSFCPSLQSCLPQVMTAVAALVPEQRSLQRDEISLMLRWHQREDAGWAVIVFLCREERIKTRGIQLKWAQYGGGLSVRILSHLLIVFSFLSAVCVTAFALFRPLEKVRELYCWP